MPNYYLISEERNEPEKPIQGWKELWKPETCNLLLPSIHSSRDDNFLLTEIDPEDAVRDLLSANKDSASWPSVCRSGACKKDENLEASSAKQSVMFGEKRVFEHNSQTTHDIKPVRVQPYQCTPPPKLPMYTKYRPSFWSYDSVDAKTLDAARSLFFERKKQKLVYEWNNPSCPPKIPSDYDMFIAWASLSKNEKMKYVDEVTGCLTLSPGQTQQPVNSLEVERAVNSLYASSYGAFTWPSFEYLRDQQNHYSYRPLVMPSQLHRYPSYLPLISLHRRPYL